MGLAQQQFFPVQQVEVQKHRRRKSHNQYFTPEFVVEKALSLIPDSKIENVIDPAVGSGIFLRIATKKWKKTKLFGVDIDKEIIKELEKSDLQNANFFYGNALLQETWQDNKFQSVISSGGFDLVVGNPPFSSWFHRITAQQILSNYKLSRRNGRLMQSQAIEILFLEIFISLCKYNGFVIIVLPDGLLSNPQYKYVREFILQETEVRHIISLPRNVFEDTSAKASVLILQKERNIVLDYRASLGNLKKLGGIKNAIEVKATSLINRMDYCYYHNLNKNSLNELMNNGINLKPLKEFLVYCKTGKTLYGKERRFSKNGLRFLHATNITEIGVNYKKDEKFIDPFSKMNFPSAYTEVGDILFVRVGVGCAGRVAIVNTEEDRGVATDYIHILRVKNINPHFLVVYLKTKYGRDSIEVLKHGVGTVSINKSDVCSILIPVVSEELQSNIEMRYQNILRAWKSTPRVYTSGNYENKMRNLITDLEKSLEKYCER